MEEKAIEISPLRTDTNTSSGLNPKNQFISSRLKYGLTIQ